MLAKKVSYILILIFYCLLSFDAKANEIDSLKRILSSNINDTTRVNVLNALSKSLFNSNPDSAIFIATNAKKLAENIHFNKGLALAIKNIGIVYYQQGKFKDAVITWQEAIEIYTKIGDKIGIANMLSNQGAVYFNQGSDAKAMDLYLKSLKIAEELNDTLRIATALYNIGAVYSNKKATWDKALDYYFRSYKLSLKINDQYSIGTSAVNIGELYYKMGKDSIALIYLYKAKKAYEGTEDLPYPLNDIGHLYTKQKKYDKAIEIHKQAYEYSKKLGTKLYQTQSLNGLGEAYSAKGDNLNAIKSYKESIEVAIPLDALTEMKDAYQGLADCYFKMSNYSAAYKYQNLLSEVIIKIYNAERDKKMETEEINYALEKKESMIKLMTKDKQIQDQAIKRQKLIKTIFIGGFAIMLLFALVFFTQRNKISKEKKRSEELLLNILPEETAEELKTKGSAEPKMIDSVTVLFTDFKGFTQLSEKLTAKELVGEINECFVAFDQIMQKYGVEKIKTIGDSYMAAGGLPAPNDTHAIDVVNAAFEIQKFMEEHKAKKLAAGQLYFEIRIGINTGSVVAGIVGIKKFSYDIWGDTVNTASRMESSGEVGKVNISGSTYELVKNNFRCIHRGKVSAKGKGEIDMYFAEKIA